MSNEPWNTKTHAPEKKIDQSQITNHDLLNQLKYFCFLRGPLRWLTAVKNANVSWLSNFRILVFMKSMVNKVTILVVVFLSHREGEELFQFLFLETEIKNSWEAYFEDAKQKLGKGLLQRILKTVLFPCLLKFAFYL